MPIPLLVLVALAAAGGGCELVLGDLPPLSQPDGGSSGTGGAHPATSSSTSSSTTSSTSSTSSGTGTVDADCCDCDGDGFEAVACGAKDCDDHDPLVYPGEPVYYAMPASNPAVGFDWDCSGTIERDPTLDVTVTCPSLTLSTCPTTTGYLATVPPACGVAGAWGTCTQQGTTCVNNVVDPARVMTCK